ncbi:hypothetical protein AB3S75_015365 [Citrus x aurantiifolia]
MTRTSVLHQSLLLAQPEEPPKGPELNLRLKEQECLTILKTCKNLEEFKKVHAHVLKWGFFWNPFCASNLVATCALSHWGSMDYACSIFRQIDEPGLAMHGQGKEALSIFSEMLREGLEPDDVVYVGVLSACSHAGLVNEGLLCFDRMKLEHRIVPTVQHYGCVVDLMGRAGMLGEALELIQSMPIQQNDVVWRSLLSASKVHHNLEIGERAAKNLFQINSHHPSDYVVLSNMYAQAQRWDDVAKIRTEMASKGLNQSPGFSLVEVAREVYKFVSQDRSHPAWDNIYEMIHQMEWQLKFEGYSPDISQVLLDVDEDEKRERLKGHSQKLAIAFALIHTSQGSPIRIARNLRMCNDCHTYTKLISVIYEREIIVRDRKRFHHFKDGTCSCRDYW